MTAWLNSQDSKRMNSYIHDVVWIRKVLIGRARDTTSPILCLMFRTVHDGHDEAESKPWEFGFDAGLMALLWQMPGLWWTRKIEGRKWCHCWRISTLTINFSPRYPGIFAFLLKWNLNYIVFLVKRRRRHLRKYSYSCSLDVTIRVYVNCRLLHGWREVTVVCNCFPLHRGN